MTRLTSRPRGASIRSALLAALLSCAWASTPAAASAASVTASPLTHDVVSEVPFTVAITGLADPSSTLTVGWAKLDEGCQGTYLDDEVLSHVPVGGAFALQHREVIDAPGPHVLCAVLQDDRLRTVAASMAPFTLRPPRSSFSVDAPPVAALGHAFRVRVRGTAEAPRSVFGKLAPPGTPCTEALESDSEPVFLNLVSGVTEMDTVEPVRLNRYGLWRACVRTRRYWTTFDPTDAVAEAPIRVTVRCTAASRELSRARDRWRAMSRRLRLRGLPPSPQLRIRGMAVRRARAWVAEACAPAA